MQGADTVGGCGVLKLLLVDVTNCTVVVAGDGATIVVVSAPWSLSVSLFGLCLMRPVVIGRKSSNVDLCFFLGFTVSFLLGVFVPDLVHRLARALGFSERCLGGVSKLSVRASLYNAPLMC